MGGSRRKPNKDMKTNLNLKIAVAQNLTVEPGLRPAGRIPPGVKLAFTAFMAVLVPTYWHEYGPTNFLYSAWPAAWPGAVTRFHTIAWSMRKRRPDLDIRTPE